MRIWGSEQYVLTLMVSLENQLNSSSCRTNAFVSCSLMNKILVWFIFAFYNSVDSDMDSPVRQLFVSLTKMLTSMVKK
jgi:hypothetical protein